MRNYSDYIQELKIKWIGKKVKFNNIEYTVVDVDYNGGLLIDKSSEHNATTAIEAYMLDEVAA
jgi:hypothetical protein